MTIPWFDTKSETYKYATAGPYTIEVTKGSGAARSTTRRYLTQEAISRVGEDIGAIKKELATNDESPAIYRKRLLQGAVIMPWLLMLLLFILKIKIKFFASNKDEQKQKQALTTALKEFKQVAKKQSDNSLVAIIDTYFSTKLGIDAGGLRRSELSELLGEGEAAKKVLAFMDSVEIARYGGGKSQEELIKEGELLLRAMDKELKA